MGLDEMPSVLFKSLQQQGHEPSFIPRKLPNRVGGGIIVTQGM
jgi:hypothetical protein